MIGSEAETVASPVTRLSASGAQAHGDAQSNAICVVAALAGQPLRSRGSELFDPGTAQ